MLIELKESFNDNGTFVPKDNRNADYQNILERIAKGEIYQAYDSLIDAKETKKQALKYNRRVFQYSNFVFDENVYKASESAQNKLANKIQSVLRSGDTFFSWNDAFDKVVALEFNKAQELLSAIILREDFAYSKYAEKLKEIEDEDCTTLEELENININFD